MDRNLFVAELANFTRSAYEATIGIVDEGAWLRLAIVSLGENLYLLIVVVAGVRGIEVTALVTGCNTVLVVFAIRIRAGHLR
jgi:hypothetical protein